MKTVVSLDFGCKDTLTLAENITKSEKKCTFVNVFVKPNEQSEACFKLCHGEKKCAFSERFAFSRVCSSRKARLTSHGFHETELQKQS
jgi:hypothetical protein